MVIVRVHSGLGNQMYQFALFVALRKRYPKQIIKLDTLSSTVTHFQHGYSDALSLFFKLDIPHASIDEIKKIYPDFQLELSETKPPLLKRIIKKFFSLILKILKKTMPSLRRKHEERLRKRHENVIREIGCPVKISNSFYGDIFYFDNKKDYYLDGYWQNLEYMNYVNVWNEVTEIFKTRIDSICLSEQDRILLDSIKYETTIAIHVRRGDNVISESQKYTFDLCNMIYYKQSIKIMDEILKSHNIFNYKYLIISNDNEYCQKAFSFLSNTIFINHPEDECHIDLLFLYKCTHAIISNSTFSLWSAYIADTHERIVVCPKYYVRHDKMWFESPVPDHWHKIDNMKLVMDDS